MIISFVSAKGGSGKTSVAASTAKVLANLGLQVLLIDFDSITNGLTLLHLENVSKIIESKNHNDKNTLKGILEMINSSDYENPTLIKLEENLEFLPFNYRYSETKSGIDYKKLSEQIVLLSK